MIDLFNLVADFKEVAHLNGLDQGPSCVGKIIRWKIMRKSTQPGIILGPVYYAYCDLKRYGKSSNVASLLRNIHKGFGSTGMRIQYDENIFKGAGITQNLV